MLERSLELAMALEHLHHHMPETFVVHRDLKPDNVGFKADGTLKLVSLFVFVDVFAVLLAVLFACFQVCILSEDSIYCTFMHALGFCTGCVPHAIASFICFFFLSFGNPFFDGQRCSSVDPVVCHYSLEK